MEQLHGKLTLDHMVLRSAYVRYSSDILVIMDHSHLLSLQIGIAVNGKSTQPRLSVVGNYFGSCSHTIHGSV